MLRIMSHTPVLNLTLKMIYMPRKNLEIHIGDQSFRHPFGIAAGMDKTARCLKGWDTIGASFVEIGGITQYGQDGNPKPRMFRSHQHKALINRMGFNNLGADEMQRRLSHHFKRFGKPSIPIWANLGKSKITSLEDAHLDYSYTMERLWDYCDAFVINVSSPNTPQLRELQHDASLVRILEACQSVNHSKSTSTDRKKPLFVKIAPDMDLNFLENVLRVSQDNGLSGIVISNTTTSRPEIDESEPLFDEIGGLSGSPLKDQSTQMIRHAYKITKGTFPIVGVGGVMNALDAIEKIRAGASLIQAYSGFVFEGPSLTKNVVYGLHTYMREHNIQHFKDLIGSEHQVHER